MAPYQTFNANIFALQELGRSLFENPDLTLQDLKSGIAILQSGYEFHSSLQKIMSADAKLGKAGKLMKGQVQVAFNSVIKKYGGGLPSEVVETFRRYIPRWQTHLLTPPSFYEIPDDYY